IARCTAAVEGLGFRQALDYTFDGANPHRLRPFARLLIHPTHQCFAEIGQITQSPVASKFGCTILSRMENDWSHYATDREPTGLGWALRFPRKLVHSIPGASPAELLQTHLRSRGEIVSSLGIRVLEASVESYLSAQSAEAGKRREKFRKMSVLAFLVRADLFDLRPRHVW